MNDIEFPLKISDPVRHVVLRHEQLDGGRNARPNALQLGGLLLIS